MLTPDAQRGGGGEEKLQLHRQRDRHKQLEKLCYTKGAVVYEGIIDNLEMGDASTCLLLN